MKLELELNERAGDFGERVRLFYVVVSFVSMIFIVSIFLQVWNHIGHIKTGEIVMEEFEIAVMTSIFLYSSVSVFLITVCFWIKKGTLNKFRGPGIVRCIFRYFCVILLTEFITLAFAMEMNTYLSVIFGPLILLLLLVVVVGITEELKN